MYFRCIRDAETSLKKLVKQADILIQPELCPPTQDGDLTINCFRLARQINYKDPLILASLLTDCLQEHPDSCAVYSVKAFVNVKLEIEALYRDSIADEQKLLRGPLLAPEKRKRILVEFSAPNTNKPQHLGHVRNNSLGMALCSILKRIGHSVVAVNLVNDRGIHICKSMLAYQRFAENTSPQDSNKKGDHFVGDFYVRFEQELQKQLQTLKQSQLELETIPDEALVEKTEIGRAAYEMLWAWERNDPDIRALWKKLNTWVLNGFAQTYSRMGVHFDRYYFESETYKRGNMIIDEGLKHGLFSVRDDGAVLIDLDEMKLGKKVVRRSDGTSIYITQDIATSVIKHEDFHPDIMIWIVGDEQIYHFKVLFVILKQLGYEWSDRCYHLSYGMVRLPSGKMKSREGTVVDADDLFDRMIELAKHACLERTDREMETGTNQRAESIAMAALKFMLLKVNPKSTINFNPDAAISFEGDTGPFVQYAYARISSIRRKAESLGYTQEAPNWGLLEQDEERCLALSCAFYTFALQQAAERQDPSVLTEYLLDLARNFNRFYKKHRVLAVEVDALRQARLALCARVQRILKDGLAVLSIDVLEKM